MNKNVNNNARIEAISDILYNAASKQVPIEECVKIIRSVDTSKYCTIQIVQTKLLYDKHLTDAGEILMAYTGKCNIASTVNIITKIVDGCPEIEILYIIYILKSANLISHSDEIMASYTAYQYLQKNNSTRKCTMDEYKLLANSMFDTALSICGLSLDMTAPLIKQLPNHILRSPEITSTSHNIRRIVKTGPVRLIDNGFMQRYDIIDRISMCCFESNDKIHSILKKLTSTVLDTISDADYVVLINDPELLTDVCTLSNIVEYYYTYECVANTRERFSGLVLYGDMSLGKNVCKTIYDKDKNIITKETNFIPARFDHTKEQVVSIGEYADSNDTSAKTTRVFIYIPK